MSPIRNYECFLEADLIGLKDTLKALPAYNSWTRNNQNAQAQFQCIVRQVDWDSVETVLTIEFKTKALQEMGELLVAQFAHKEREDEHLD